MTKLILFPHQLYAPAAIKGYLKQLPDDVHEVVLVEEPAFFSDATHKANKAKCAFHRASMKSVASEWRSSGIDVTYMDYVEASRKRSNTSSRVAKHVYIIDPCDHALTAKYRDEYGDKLTVLPDSHGFLASREVLEAFHAGLSSSKSKRVSFQTFMEFMKTARGVMVGVPSTDAENRRKYSSDELPPGPPTYDTAAHSEAVEYVESTFPKGHWGASQSVFQYPATRRQAHAHFEAFLRDRFDRFGPFQDAVRRESPVLFHAHISFLLNAGLLSPAHVLAKVEKLKTDEQNSAEAFVRQVLGWREYMRYVYLFHLESLHENAWGNDRTLVVDAWYGGKTGIVALDSEIRKAERTGYAHHIVRLMYFLNAMVLSGVHPSQIVKWFMEVVSIDAYPWVMWSNVAVMGGFTESKTFAHKPYVCSSSYVASLSDYPRDRVLDSLFYSALYHKKDYVMKHARSYARNLAYFERLPAEERKEMLRVADQFIRKTTTKL